MSIILKAENISKQYRLGSVGTGTISHDLNRWWAGIRGKEDPYLKVGSVNDRSIKADSNYVWALQDINFEVQRGEVLGIIGKNGAGKSTLLKILSRVTTPTTGEIKTKGRIASLLEVGTGFHPEMTGRENVYLNGAILGMTKKEITSKLDEIIAFSGCERYIDTPVKRYSSGMTVRLAFAVAAHLEPDILVIDEVLAVGDAEFQKKAIGKMQDISKGEGRTVLFVSHNMAAVKSLCTRAIVLEHGAIVFEGKVDDAVDFYISEANAIGHKEVYFNKSHRRGITDHRLSMIKIIAKNEKTTIRGALKFDIYFEVYQNIQKAVCLTGSICALDDTAIGSFFTQNMILKEGKHIVELELPNHNLSVGVYYLNLSISKGSVENSNLERMDHAYQAIAFEILQMEDDGDYISNWNGSWGNLFFQSHINLTTIEYNV
ncbi:polysaccharide ABC transporter ATP-binding protein [Gelidibacter mesophilus]|uniref:ABC transporter ATP-binding protein n=1 Tax=Gelidibacter mesophilus TaxID=169050 RepID=UPI000410D46A|nr:ABC transporter ATP-binding protein [Gelidibacter mesophilus]